MYVFGKLLYNRQVSMLPTFRSSGLQRGMRPELMMKNGYRWSGGLQVDQARRLNELEQERAKLKRLVSKLSIEKVVLKDIAAEPSCQH